MGRPRYGYGYGYARSGDAPINPSTILGVKLAAWFDPSDLGTMYSDFVGTPAAIGQPVALQLDKKPGLGALGPELVTNGGFDSDTAWAKVATAPATCTISGGKVTLYSPAGEATNARQTILTVGRVYKVTGSVTVRSGTVKIDTGNSIVISASNPAFTYYIIPTATDFFLSRSGACDADFDNISVKEVLGTPRYQSTLAQRPILGRMPKSGRRNIIDGSATMATQTQAVTAAAHTLSFTGTGTVTLSGASTAGPLVGTGANNRVSLTFTPTAGNLTLTVTGSVTNAQLELGSSVTNYQTTASAYDCTEAPYSHCYYLAADGSDDGMVTPSLDLSGVSAIAVFAGLRKLSDAAAGVFLEFSASVGSNSGAFNFLAPSSNGGGNIRFSSKGTTLADTSAILAAPATAVISGIGNISAPSAILRVNGAQATPTTTSQGTGNYSNNPLYFYRRGGSSLPAKVYDFGTVIATGTLTSAQITAMERYIARNTPEVSL